jgi:hypothetical protein
MRLQRQIVSFTIASTPVAFSQTLAQGAAEVPNKQPIAQSQTIDGGAPQQRLWLRRCCFSGRGSDRIAQHPPGSRVTARPTSTSWVASTASRRRCCLAARTWRRIAPRRRAARKARATALRRQSTRGLPATADSNSTRTRGSSVGNSRHVGQPHGGLGIARCAPVATR